MPTYPGKWKLLFEIEKVKLKTKKLLKITILDEQESSVQSVDRQNKGSASLELGKYVY